MASLKEVIKNNKIEIESGIPWVAIWKNGRSWYGKAFWYEDGDYQDGYTFEQEYIDSMREIAKEDPCAVMLNGYYSNCGVYEDGTTTLAGIASSVEWNYYNRYNQLFAFIDDMIIPNK